MLTVIKLGGALLNNVHALKTSLQYIVLLNEPVVLVHGGGRTASDWMKKLGISPQMINGRRITNDDTIEIVSMVYAGLNKQIVSQLHGMGQKAVGLCGADENCIQANIRPKKPIDFGWVGDIDQNSVNSKVFLGYLNHGITPVVAPLTHNGNGQLLNTNADTIASTLAQSLQILETVRLVYLFEKAGVLEDVDNENSIIQNLSADQFNQLKKEGKIHSGMIPKLDNGFNALKAGVNEVMICHPSQLQRRSIKTELSL